MRWRIEVRDKGRINGTCVVGTVRRVETGEVRTWADYEAAKDVAEAWNAVYAAEGATDTRAEVVAV